jgi:N-terminal domain on NACHT_NTPase and P-loop NTPases
MAEALAAAGLASSIITFIEFGVKLAKLTKQVYDAHGELPKDLQKCQSIVDEFSDWVRNLKTRQDTALPPSHCEHSLKRALDECINDCDELLGIFENLLSKGTAGKASFKLVLRAMRKEGRIEKAQKSLENHKNELRLRIAERTMEMVEETR